MVYNHNEINKKGGLLPPFFIHKCKKMINGEIIYYIKYTCAILVLLGIILAPAWVARQNGHGKPRMQAVRISSWVFGWSIIAWLWSLFQATKK